MTRSRETGDVGYRAYKKNYLINGGFQENQREVSGTVVLAAGAYGHDRFRAGSGGCTYTFATTAGKTTLTITAGTLEQEIEGDHVLSQEAILSWGGTAQGQIDGGGYGVTGVVATAFGGVNAIVEFNTGTLELVQLEEGSTATEFEYVSPAQNLAECQRYYQEMLIVETWNAALGTTSAGNNSCRLLPTQMRGNPTVDIEVNLLTDCTVSAADILTNNTLRISRSWDNGTAATARNMNVTFKISAEL